MTDIWLFFLCLTPNALAGAYPLLISWNLTFIDVLKCMFNILTFARSFKLNWTCTPSIWIFKLRKRLFFWELYGPICEMQISSCKCWIPGVQFTMHWLVMVIPLSVFIFRVWGLWFSWKSMHWYIILILHGCFIPCWGFNPKRAALLACYNAALGIIPWALRLRSFTWTGIGHRIELLGDHVDVHEALDMGNLQWAGDEHMGLFF